MMSDKAMAHQFPEQVDEYIGYHIATTHSLTIQGRKQAFRDLGINYQQLMSARNMERGLGATFFASINRQNWLSEPQRIQLKELYQIHRTYWNTVDNRRKIHASPSIGRTDVTAFKRLAAAQLPHEAANIQKSMFLVNVDAFARLCEVFIEDMRISGHGFEAMKNGLCICRWIIDFDDDSLDASLALASALRFTLYAAYHIHDRRVFDRLLREMHDLAKRSNDAWIKSAYHQNCRRRQISFLEAAERNLDQIIQHSRETVRTISEWQSQDVYTQSSWVAAPLLAQSAYVQSLVLVGEINKFDIRRLNDELIRYTLPDSGAKSDAILITHLVLAEAYLSIFLIENCCQHLDYVSNQLQFEMAHRFDGIRAVLYRIRGDVSLFSTVEKPPGSDGSADEAIALYDLAAYYFTRSGNIHLGIRLKLRKDLVNSITENSNALWNLKLLRCDYRFREPIW